MECGQCGAGNRDGARFCSSCGAAFGLGCASCGSELGATARFCDHCGTPVVAEAPAVPAGPAATPDEVPSAELSPAAARAIALARLDELGAPLPDDARSPNVANLATHVHATILAAINADDLELQRALTTPSFCQDDRRAVVAVPDQDRRGIARYHRIMLEQGYEILPPEPIAVRGDLLSLARVTHRTAAGDESILLAIIELDRDGRVARATSFDEGDLAAALSELDERYARSEGAPPRPVL